MWAIHMPMPARAAPTAGSARQLWLRRHCVAVTHAMTRSHHDGSPLRGVAILSGSILIIGLQPGVDPDDCPPPAVTDTIGGPVAAECAGSNPARLRFPPAAFFRDSELRGVFQPLVGISKVRKYKNMRRRCCSSRPPGGTDFS
jgi:hypothetical protein